MWLLLVSLCSGLLPAQKTEDYGFPVQRGMVHGIVAFLCLGEDRAVLEDSFEQGTRVWLSCCTFLPSPQCLSTLAGMEGP